MQAGPLGDSPRIPRRRRCTPEEQRRLAIRATVFDVTRLLTLAAASLLLACSSETPAASDSGISFTPPDTAVEEMDTSTPPPLSVGRPCTSNSECPEDASLCLTDEGFRDGVCTEFCMDDGATDCPEGSHCTSIGFMRWICLRECDHRLEKPCRPGYGCGERASAAPVCLPGCDIDADCPAGLLCHAEGNVSGEGGCYDPEAAISDPCTDPDDCNAGGWCIREIDRGWPGGACTIFRCDEDADTGCPGDAHCVFDFYRDSICVDGCTVDADCRDGYACLPDETYPDRRRCTPHCDDDAQCVVDSTHCDLDTGRCV